MTGIRRAIYEWGAIIRTPAAIACLTWWLLSSFHGAGDFRFHLPLGEWKTMEVEGSNGRLVIIDRYGTRDLLDIVEQGGAFDPPVEKIVHKTIPGGRFRLCAWGGGPPHWLVEISALYPTLLLGALAWCFVYRYRGVRRAAASAQGSPLATVTHPPLPHPLDR
jgi:hypothetical protein